MTSLRTLRRFLSALVQIWPTRRYPHSPEVEALLKDWIPAAGHVREAANENFRSKATAP